MFWCKYSIIFGTYLLSCRFHCVDIFYTKFRSCETFTVTNSGAILLLIETLSNFRAINQIADILHFNDSDNYRKTSGSLWQYCRDERNSNITEFKSKLFDNTYNAGIINAKIGMPSKYKIFM